VRRIQCKEVPPILEHDARAGDGDAAPKAHIEAIDQRAGVALAIHRRQVHGIVRGGQRPGPRIRDGVIQRDLRATAQGVRIGEEALHRHIGQGRIGHIAASVHHRQLDGFHLEVQRIRIVRGHAPEVIALQDVQCQEHGDSLPVGWALPDSVSPVEGREGIHPSGTMVDKVLEREQASPGLAGGDDGARDGATIEGSGAALRQEAQARREIRQAYALAGQRRAAIRHKDAGGLGIAAQQGLAALPQASDRLRDGVSFPGIGDGRGQVSGEPQTAKAGREIAPGGRRTGHGDGQHAALRHSLQAPGGIGLRCGGPGCTAATIQGIDLAVRSPVDQGKDVPTQAGAHRFDDVEHGGRRQRCIDGIATGLQGLQTRLGRQWLAGSDGTVKTGHHRTTRRAAAPLPVHAGH